MKLEDIAKTVIKDLEALGKEKNGLNENLQDNSGKNSANLADEISDDDDLEIYSDIVLPNTKKSDLIAFNFHFESINLKEKKEDKKEDFSDEISDLANEKYDFTDEKTDENLQNEIENLQNEIENLENENLKSEFENLENEDFSDNSNNDIINDFDDEELEIIRDEKFENSQNENLENLENTNLQNPQEQISQENQLLDDINSQNFTQNSLYEEKNLENSQNSQNSSAELAASISKISELLANLSEVKNDEVQFLSALKERILVLFEGLNAFEGDLEARVELSIKFMEFLLASIDNRVENLSK